MKVDGAAQLFDNLKQAVIQQLRDGLNTNFSDYLTGLLDEDLQVPMGQMDVAKLRLDELAGIIKGFQAIFKAAVEVRRSYIV